MIIIITLYHGLLSDELEISFSDDMRVYSIKNDNDATIAFFPIPYNPQTNYKRDVWLYKHGYYDGLNSGIDQFDWLECSFSIIK